MSIKKKNYHEWMLVKSKVHNKNKVRKINEGDVVWVAIGENVGVEIDGKKQVAVLIQARLIDGARVYSRIGELSKKDYNKVLEAYINFIKQ